MPRSLPWIPVTAMVVGLALIAAGLAEAKPPKRAPKPVADAPVAAVGSVRGTVVFKGTAPARVSIDRASDPFCAKTQATDDAVVISDGGVEAVFVRVIGKELPRGAVPDAPVVIDQNACAYAPRVVGAVAGQTVLIKNSDGTLHNVHAYLDGATEFNLAQPKGVPAVKRTLDDPGIVELKCDVHAWMRAWAVVVEHPFFAVTGKGGAFEIAGVPAGSYELEAWHPVLGKRTAKLTVAAGKTATATLELAK